MRGLGILSLAGLLVILGSYRDLTFGSQTTWPASYRQKIATRTYELGYKDVFKIVQEVTTDNGYPIVVSNKETGIIITDYKSADTVMAGRGKIKLDYLVTAVDEKTSKVNLYIRCEIPTRYGTESLDSFIDEDSYRSVFDAITKKVDAMIAVNDQKKETEKKRLLEEEKRKKLESVKEKLAAETPESKTAQGIAPDDTPGTGYVEVIKEKETQSDNQGDDVEVLRGVDIEHNEY